jgi:hypothetical protein
MRTSYLDEIDNNIIRSAFYGGYLVEQKRKKEIVIQK